MANDLLKLLNVQSIAEIYCELVSDSNQLNFVNQLIAVPNSLNVSYLGLHPDQKVIFNNRHFFRLDKSKFFSELNAVKEPLPKCDLLILNKFFFSLPKEEIWQLLANIKDSGAKYLMVENNADLSSTPFFLPKSELVARIHDSLFDIYRLDQIAFLLDYLPDEDSAFRAKFYKLMREDFVTLRVILGDAVFRKFLMSFKDGWEKNINFVNQVGIVELLLENNGLGFALRDYYYRIIYQIELNLVSQKSGFINEKNFYKSYLVLMNYINFLLFDQTHKI